MSDAKFIVVQDAKIANKMILCGFNLVCNTGETYTFMNIVPKHFSFESIDVKKLAYTNTLIF